jgi:hypothetical protein
VGELAGQVGGALDAPGRQELRADLHQVVLQDRDAARIAEPAQVLEYHGRRHLGVLVQHRRDLLAIGIEQGALGRSPIVRRFGAIEQPRDRVAGHPQTAGDRRLGQVLAVVEPVDLGPILH